jgi:hypothetical protein
LQPLVADEALQTQHRQLVGQVDQVEVAAQVAAHFLVLLGKAMLGVELKLVMELAEPAVEQVQQEQLVEQVL